MALARAKQGVAQVLTHAKQLRACSSVSFTKRVPTGDDKPRLVCDTCSFVQYQNPLIVGGVVATTHNKVLLLKRDIEPRKGYWTLPGGFMECGESVQAGAAREAEEEGLASVQVKHLLSMYSVPHISQVHVWFLADLLLPEHPAAQAAAASRAPVVVVDGEQEPGRTCEQALGFGPGHETTAAGLFPIEDIPWDSLAFPSGRYALEHFIRTRGSAPHTDVRTISKQPGLP